MKTWYKNAGRTLYHLAREDWQRTGLAVCGVSIASPAYTFRNDETPIVNGIRLSALAQCKTCRKIRDKRPEAAFAGYTEREWRAYAEGRYTFRPPAVSTWMWSEESWMAYIFGPRPTRPTFPVDTVKITDPRGFPHIGHITDHRDDENGTALYYFPGDFVAGDGFELWLTPEEARDRRELAALAFGDETE